MKNIFKLFLGLLTISSMSIIPTTIVSCGSSLATESSRKVTIVAPAASSMNFIRYKASAHLAAPTVLPLIEAMPNKSLKNKYQLLKATMMDDVGAMVSSKALTYGAMKPNEDGESFKLDQSGKNITIILRDNLTWSNGDKLVAENWVDTIKAMLDINNASEYLYTIERLGIQNASESYQAQVHFFDKYNFFYDDPFNYKNKKVAVSSEEYNKNKDEYFPYILKNNLNLGIRSDGDNKIILTFNHKESLNFFDNIISPIFWPINRKFISEHGGFDEFGKSSNNFVVSGSFKPIYFDQKYGIEFARNPKYYNKDAVILENIVFRFITNLNTQAILYKDGKLLNSPVSKDQLYSYMSNPELRQQLSRTPGVGTLSLFFNRYEKNLKNKYFSNINFRKAISFGINRKDLLSALNLDFSNPVSIYTAAVAQTPDAKAYLSEFIHTMYNVRKPNNELVEKKFMISSLESRLYSYKNDYFKRNDLTFDTDLAREFLEQAKKEIGLNNFPMKIQFPYSSTDPVGKSLAIVLQGFLDKTFRGDVILETKSLPQLVYQNYISTGKWDLIIKQVDPLTRRPWDYLGEFIRPDAPDPEHGKVVGYLRNQAGGFTYTDYFRKISDSYEENLKKDYGITNFDFDISKWFITFQDINDTNLGLDGEFSNNRLKYLLDTKYKSGTSNYSALTLKQKKLYILVKNFFGSIWAPLVTEYDSASKENKENILNKLINAKTSFMESTIPYDISFSTVYKTIDKIQRDMIPTIPIAEADNKWTVSRFSGFTTTPQGHWANPEYLYNALDKPFPWLEDLNIK